MNYESKVEEKKEDLRIKDRNGHYLGKLIKVGSTYSTYIYCKKCKSFHLVPPSK